MERQTREYTGKRSIASIHKKHQEVIHEPLEDFKFFVIFSVLIAKQETIVVISTRLAAWGFALVFAKYLPEPRLCHYFYNSLKIRGI